MSNYATKADLKNATGVDTSDFAKKTDLAHLKTTPADVSKLSNAVKTDAVKKTDYNELIKEFNNINTADATDLVKRTIIPRLINHEDGEYITTQEFNKSA